MANVIPPITPPNVNNPNQDKVVSGEITKLPEPIINIRPAENLLLNILIKTDFSPSATLPAMLNVALNGKETEVLVELKLDAKLDLPKEVNNQVLVKVSTMENGRLGFKLVSINNEKPSGFIASQQAKEGAVQPENSPVNRQQTPPSLPLASEAKAGKPLIIDTSTSVRQAKIHPMDLAPVIDNLTKGTELTPQIAEAVVKSFGDAKIVVKLTQVIEPNVIVNKQILSNPQFTKLPELNIPLQDSMERIQLILNGFSEELRASAQNTPSEEALKELVSRLKTEILPFKNVSIAGDAVTIQENQVVAVKTPLGNFLLETPLKAADNSRMILEIKEINIPDKNQNFSLSDLVPSQKLIEDLIDLRPLLGNNPAPISKTPVAFQKILEIFQPLKDVGRQDLSAKIMGKIPSLNDKMLPNMVSFVKGAMNRNLNDWLGKEIIDDLAKSGAEGKEVASRLNNFMNANNREGISWRLVEIPFFNGENLSKIRIAVKKYNEDEEEKERRPKSQSGTRFVVDTSFSKLGDFQFDGFSIAKDRRFDLIIRTSKAVDDDLSANMMRIFKTTLNDVEYVGNIKVNIKENFIKVYDDEHNEILKSGIYI